MKKKLLCIVLAVAVIFSALGVTASANDVVSENTVANICVETLETSIPFEGGCSSDFGNISIKQAAVINGVSNNLYPTFDDPASALKTVKEKILNLIDVIGKNYPLETLSTDNAKEFFQYVMDYCTVTDSNQISNELRDEIQIFRSFYDIYENDEKNEDLISLTQMRSAATNLDIMLALPYTSPFFKEYEKKQIQSRAAAQTFNIENGVSYAEKYAVNANSDEYGVCSGGDCTNFASQILIGGGIKQHDEYGTTDKSKGWWHISTGSWPFKNHTYSYSWTLADNFCKFMGVGQNKWQLFYTFSLKLKRGDLIAYDDDYDGDWDHLGFVTNIAASATEHNGIKYRDFKVAQHTYNYNAWVSSDQNGWETMQNKAVFAIVRAGGNR